MKYRVSSVDGPKIKKELNSMGMWNFMFLWFQTTKLLAFILGLSTHNTLYICVNTLSCAKIIVTWNLNPITRLVELSRNDHIIFLEKIKEWNNYFHCNKVLVFFKICSTVNWCENPQRVLKGYFVNVHWAADTTHTMNRITYLWL